MYFNSDTDNELKLGNSHSLKSNYSLIVKINIKNLQNLLI